MGLGQNLKDFYYSLEDGYYKVLDGLNKVIPIYKVVDPIDQVMPSFLLLVLLLVVGAVGAFFLLQPGLTPPPLGPKTVLSLQVTDAAGNPLGNASVSLTADADTFTLTTDSQGAVSIELPEGSQVALIVTRDGFEGVQKSFVFGKDTAEQRLALAEKAGGTGNGGLGPEALGKSISFTDASGQKILKPLTVRLSCSNLGVSFLQDTYTVTNGTLSYVPPDGCGSVLVNVEGSGISSDSFVDDGSGVLHLQQAVVREGGILVRLNPALDGTQVELRDAVGVSVDQGFTSYGEKAFKTTPGTYYVVVTDTSGAYANAQSDKFVVYADQTKTVDVTLTKEVQAVINVKVLDKVSGNAVTAAKVTLKRETGEAIGSQAVEQGKSQVTFSLEEKGKYFVEAYHDDYLSSADVAVDASNASKAQPLNVEVKLEKLTPENSGQVEVLVQDEEKQPVVNAKVNMYYALTKFICEACGAPSTDDKGLVRFKGLKPGKYLAYAQKFPATGKSPEQELLVKQITKFTIDMKIGFGTLKVNARDADGQGVPFVDVEVFNAAGTKLGTLSADDKGVATHPTKADTAVYARVSKTGRTSWTSRVEQVFPDQTIEFNALLVEKIEGREPKIVFEGLFDKTNTKVKAMVPGERYKVRFYVQVPSASTLKALTFFLRTGSENAVEKDAWFVNNLNIPTTSIIRGTTWNPPAGNDRALLTNGDAKWAEVSWMDNKGMQPGIYNVDVELKVRQEAQAGAALPLSYRIQAEELQGKFLRDPVDSTLGDRKETADKKELYANSYDKTFNVGQAESCANGFCYSEKVFDPIDDVYLKEPFQLRVFQKYRFESTVTNDSPTVHDNANLRIRVTQDGLKMDDRLVIDKYTVVNADSTPFSETGQRFELPPIGLGRFTQSKTAKTQLEVEARKQGQTNVQQLMVSSGREAFNRLTAFTIFSEQQLKIDLDQDVIPAYIETRVIVHITYAGGENSGFDTDGALVRLRRRTPDLAETVQIKTTGPKGTVEFVFPASPPGTKLTVEVEKRGFMGEAVALEISDKPVDFSPATLTYSLGLTTNNERDAELKITSKVPQKLYISKLLVKGDKFRGLLDLQKMQNYLNQYTVQPFWLEENTTKSLNVKATVSALAKLLKEKTSVEGSLYIELSNESRTATYVYSVPLKVDIGLAEKPKIANCLTVQPNAWKDTTFTSKLVKEIVVKNNCVTKDGTPMGLNNLTAMMVWQGDIVGYVEITLNDTSAGAAPTMLVQSNRQTKLFETVPADKEYVGSLTFTPLPDASVLGKTAKFSVILDAEVLSDTGPVSVGTSKVDGELLITNLDQCVKFTPDSQNGVRIKRGDEDGNEKFQVDTKACGNVDVDFKFCDHDDCRGGASEGGINLEPFEISNAKPDKTYDVLVTKKTVPGYYGVPVYARPAGGGWRQIAEYKVIVESDGYLDFDKYTFYTPPGQTDSAILKNFKLREDVAVTADMCAWDESSKSGVGKSIAAGVVVGALVVIAGAVPLIGIIVAVVVAVVLAIFGVFDEDCHDTTDTHTLPDYVINLNGVGKKGAAIYLPPDAQSVILDKEKLVGMFNLAIADCLDCGSKNSTQTVGVNFQNLGILDEKPTYAIATILTKIHHHGDPLHAGKAAVTCDNGEFAGYWIGAPTNQGACVEASDGEYREPIHVRFITQTEKLEIPRLDFDTFACNAGTSLGVNGPGALPKTRLNWNWNGSDAIQADSCNADNANGIYCDATQLNIAIVKRLEAFDEFLKANNYQFTCPSTDETGKVTTQFNTDNALHTVDAGSVGASSIIGTQNGDDMTVQVTATNNGTAPADASVSVRMNGTAGGLKTCTIALAGISNLAGVNSKTGECIMADLADGIYTAVAEVTSSSAASIDSASVAFAFRVNLNPQPSEIEQKTGCGTPRSTETTYGESTINRFIKADSSVNWTARVPNVQALNQLTKFNAMLMADGYSEDFIKDFGEYYTNVAFADADTAFHSLGTAPGNKKYGFNQLYLQQNKLFFTRRFENNVNTIQAGIYEVELGPLFTNDWRFFDDQGNVKGKMSVSLYRVADPVPNSMFYRLPFDGLVGLKKDRFDRQGYGVSFVNLNPTETVRIDNGAVALTSYPDAGSNPMNKIFTSIEKDIKTINTSPQFKGIVLRMETQGEGAVKMTMAPSYATPVVLEMNKKEISTEPFGAFYLLSDKELPVNTGTSLTEWSGAGACLNFDGQLVTEAFFHKPDRSATQKDRLFNFQNAYTVDWSKADYAGKVDLRTIIYTPRHMSAVLRAEEPKGSLNFLTADEYGAVVKLQGISSMQYNRPGRATSDYINSVEDVFSLVKRQLLCAREEGTSVSFFWDPTRIYKQAGAKQSIHDFTQKLEAGKTCIGYSASSPPRTGSTAIQGNS